MFAVPSGRLPRSHLLWASFLSEDVALLILRILKKFVPGDGPFCWFLHSRGVSLFGVFALGLGIVPQFLFVFDSSTFPESVFGSAHILPRVMRQSSLFSPRPGVSLMVCGDRVGFVCTDGVWV